MYKIRLGIGTFAATEFNATGSVGVTIAANANAIANDKWGMILWMRKPTPMTLNITKPNANSKIAMRSRNKPFLGIVQPSKKSNGGKKSKKKRSGSSSCPRSKTPEMIAPSAICINGKGTDTGTMRTRYPLAATANNIANTILMDDMGNWTDQGE